MRSQHLNHSEYDPVRVRSPDHVTFEPEPEPPNSPPSDKNKLTPAKWGVGWQIPAMMIGFVICGAGGAVGHHFYYRSLDDTVVNSIDQQTWAIRIGTGLAFLTRTFLVAAVGVAAAQEMWATLRKKTIRLYGIDSMFAVLNNPISFFTWDLWVYAKTLTLLAIISWLIPLTAIITPATLSVRLLTTTNITQIRVPTVNFGSEDFWYPWVTFAGYGYISSPAPDISRLAAAMTSSIETLPVPAPFPNSSYTLDFWGPSYKCEKLSEVIIEMEGVTFTQEFGDNYTSLQALWDSEMNNTEVTQLPDFYAGAAPSLLNNTFFIYAAGQNPLWTTDNKTELVCRLYNTSYSINLTFTDGRQTLTPLSVVPFRFANWTSDMGRTAPHSQAALEPPFVNGGFHILHLLFGGLLERHLVTSATGSLSEFNARRESLSITQSALFSCPEMWNSSTYRNLQLVNDPAPSQCRNGTLASAIEDLSRNFTYSLLSLNAANTTADVAVSFPQNFYRYDRRNLLIAYAVGVGATVGCVLIGVLALARNGVAQNTTFSSVLLTTRNPELDSLAVGHCLGRDELEEEVGKVRLRFGEVRLGGGEGHTGDTLGMSSGRHAAFGTRGNVRAIVKGGEYY
ncbi:hypothetical protein BJX65DRAFT_209519 [Aspergillus insuetus]